MTEQDRKELHKECFKLFGYTACKESYEMAKGVEAVVEYVLNKVVNLPMHDVSYCAEQTKNLLTNKFCKIAKKHVGETFDKVPEANEILNAIDVIKKHCS